MAEGVVAGALALARKHEEKLRFLVTGVVNTAIGYALFALMLLLWGVARYNFALVSGWVVSVCVSYGNFKLFVFKTRGTNWVAELGRSYVVYSAALLVNLAVLNAFVRLAHMHPLVGQAASILIVTMMSYLGHKYFTFRHVIEAVDDGGVMQRTKDED
ncbi:MAG TPA: GtrA family protein [Coriobacteriia bacterium]|jgi:putative flippase GtrA